LQILRKHELFGQFGKIHKIVVNKHNVYNGEMPAAPSYSAYITYQKKEDAAKAITVMNGVVLDGKTLRFTIAIDIC
jgi:CCR4-NOT transcription complex subunit 4